MATVGVLKKNEHATYREARAAFGGVRASAVWHKCERADPTKQGGMGNGPTRCGLWCCLLR